jgi:probable F420-dependent oxidoreductase
MIFMRLNSRLAHFMAIQFGVTVLPDPPHRHFLELLVLAEEQGFEVGWTYDSHVLWHESTPLLTLAAERTSRMKLGHFVTNPGTREPTVLASMYATMHVLSGGRMVMGIGRGDSARRVMGKPPTTLARLEAATNEIRDLVEGRTYTEDGTDMHFIWTRRDKLPVWIAGYGPKALELTARIADGVILQLADVDLVRWFVGQLRDYARAAGRDPEAIKVMAAAPAHIGDLEMCRDRVRWFPALVSNHVVDLVNKYPREALPESLTGYIRDREGYDYRHNAEVGSANAGFVGDEVTDRFCVLGSVDDHVAKLRRLAEVGVDQFNIYLMNGDEESILEVYGREVIPAISGAVAG